jgi:hypothetical protein
MADVLPDVVDIIGVVSLGVAVVVVVGSWEISSIWHYNNLRCRK